MHTNEKASLDHSRYIRSTTARFVLLSPYIHTHTLSTCCAKNSENLAVAFALLGPLTGAVITRFGMGVELPVSALLPPELGVELLLLLT